MALSCAVVAVSGILLALCSNFDPFSGPARLIYGFEAVIIGGLGSLWGTLVGGTILGIAQLLGAQISPSFQILAGHLVFFILAGYAGLLSVGQQAFVGLGGYVLFIATAMFGLSPFLAILLARGDRERRLDLSEAAQGPWATAQTMATSRSTRWGTTR